MAQAVLYGDPPITLALRQSPRARRISLRVSRVDGRVTLSLPSGIDAAEALDFARGKETWLRGVLAECCPELRVVPGQEIRIGGRRLTVVPGESRCAQIVGDRVEVPADRYGPRLAALLKLLAAERARLVLDVCAARLGRSYGRLSLRDPRSRWGSCSASGDIMLSWRLILAPTEVFDYVAAHEAAHLERMDHSAAFWAVVERLSPGSAGPRAWLRRNGADLHRWRFCE